MEVASGQRAENVAVIVLNGFSPFELGVVCEVFGVDRTDEGRPAYDFAVVAGEPGPLRSETGFVLQTEFGLDRLETADLIAVPAVSDVGPRCPAGFPEPLLAALRQGVDRAPGCSASATARSCWPRPGCWTTGGAPALAAGGPAGPVLPGRQSRPVGSLRGR